MITLDADAVTQGLPWIDLIQALRLAFQADIVAPQRHVHTVPGGSLLLMPAWQPGRMLGVKIVTVFPGNRALGRGSVGSHYLLCDGVTGEALALLDGEALTARRTAAASALAASYLARPDASRLLVVGAGQVASLLPAAYRAVRPIERVQVWNRTPEGSARLAADLVAEGFAAFSVADLGAAIAGADIVTCATLATTALVRGAELRPGVHLDLIGGFTRNMREADDAALRRARVFIDTDAALAEAGDLAGLDPADIAGTLATLCAGGPGRRTPDEITLFKSVGTALEDLAAAGLALQRHDRGPTAQSTRFPS